MFTRQHILTLTVCAMVAGTATSLRAGVDLNWTQRGADAPSSSRSAWMSGHSVERMIIDHNNNLTSGTTESRDPLRWLYEAPDLGKASLGELLEHGDNTRLTFDRMAWTTVVQVLYYQPGDWPSLEPEPQGRAWWKRPDLFGQAGFRGDSRQSGGGGSSSNVDPNAPEPMLIPEPTMLGLWAGVAGALALTRRPRHRSRIVRDD